MAERERETFDPRVTPARPDLAACAAAENDPLWRMPLWRPYDQMLDSKVADLNNVASGNFAAQNLESAQLVCIFISQAETIKRFSVG